MSTDENTPPKAGVYFKPGPTDETARVMEVAV
jgi:hypothetical protein